MAVEAYVLINCDHRKGREVQKKLLKIGGVQDARIVTGPYDLVALVAAANFKILGDVLISKIQSTQYVTKTLTNIILE
jgi:DNA-binding Lrp family transcriptional regulator